MTTITLSLLSFRREGEEGSVDLPPKKIPAPDYFEDTIKECLINSSIVDVKAADTAAKVPEARELQDVVC